MLLRKERKNKDLTTTMFMSLAECIFHPEAVFTREIHCPPLHPADSVEFPSMLTSIISTARYLSSVIRMPLRTVSGDFFCCFR